VQLGPEVYIIEDARKNIPKHTVHRLMARIGASVQGGEDGLRILSMGGLEQTIPCDFFLEREDGTFEVLEDGYRVTTPDGTITLTLLTAKIYHERVSPFIHPSWVKDAVLDSDAAVQAFWRQWL
jgi:hypothetical protein